MADEKKLSIQIETTSTGTGAKDSADALHKLNDATNEAGAASKKAGEGADEHHKKLLGLNFEMGESRRLMRDLSEQAPALVEGFRAFLNPLTGGLTLALGLFAEAKAKLSEFNKQLDEEAAQLAEHYGNMAEAIADANRKIAASHNDVTAALKNIADGERALKTQIDETTDSIRRQEQAQVAITDAIEAEQLAAVHAEEKLGIMDAASAARAESKIKFDAEHRRNQLADTAAAGVIAQKVNAVDNAKLEEHRVAGIVDKLAPGEAHRMAEADILPKRIAGMEKERDAADAKVKEQQEHLQHAIDAEENVRPEERGLWHQHQVVPAQEELGKLQGNRDRISHAIESEKNTQAKYGEEQKNYEKAKDALEKIKETVRDLEQEVIKLRTVATEGHDTRETISGIHRDTENINNLGSAAAALPGLAKTTGHNQDQLADGIAGLLTNIIRGQDKVVGAVKTSSDSVGRLDARIDDLVLKVAEQARQITGNAGFHGVGQ